MTTPGFRLAPDASTPAIDHPDHERHTDPLDSLLVALDESQCRTCLDILRMLKSHIEEDIPAGAVEQKTLRRAA